MGSLKSKKPIRGYPSFSPSLNTEPHPLQHPSQPLPASLASPRPPPRLPTPTSNPPCPYKQYNNPTTGLLSSAAQSQELHLRKYLKGGEHVSGICEMLAMRVAEIRLWKVKDRLVELQDEHVLELEHATRMLNHSDESLVLQIDFPYMLELVDFCIDFLKAHFREAELDLLHFQQCMTRTMTLAGTLFVGSFECRAALFTVRGYRGEKVSWRGEGVEGRAREPRQGDTGEMQLSRAAQHGRAGVVSVLFRFGGRGTLRISSACLHHTTRTDGLPKSTNALTN
ncbi:uncharacterized protein STEHIDRAFT_173053 [Stereum hirsutum FP-91666 SS1]|uniref:Conserved oligomeric Golgi complex subunit 3 N-terminal domain-containing protein n=1 Tax=Stereum hirsutum (strain FP-91666) TaxID=721885 RepID=R7RXG7_STEHR|nr:uncharacterized protein STEHIDRAFT_173053 [Stereum hirsutum FP-91666 SS1]EIM79518.1 hypothetical protein STEHIDRAFT_173053 [Stereum hirsutum FP-91666 SS1]